MRARIDACLIAITLVAGAALPGRAAAHLQHDGWYPYVLIDLGTFGGPQSQIFGPSVRLLTDGGLLSGAADTPISDTDYPNGPNFGPDPYVYHAFVWRQGVKTNLGALPGNNSSFPNWMNAWGDAAGTSETGDIDPLVGLPVAHAVVWKDGRLTDLGTFGGYESGGLALNDGDQVVGFATNTIPDPFSLLGFGAQLRAFLWQEGHMRDLGTLGGADAWPQAVNNSGQIAGFSYTSAIANPATGIPTQDPFLWQDGHMRDLGSLGGTISVVNALNEHGEVVGQSNLAGDQTFHPFLWDGRTLRDLGTLGGDYGAATWITDAGDVAGWAQTPGDATVHAVLWRAGAPHDLGVPPGDDYSVGFSSNRVGQVVGFAGAFGGVGHGFLWEHGTITDLNTLVAPSDLHVTEASNINDRGEIAAVGVLPDGRQRAVLLVPTGLAATEGLASNAPAPGTVRASAAPHTSAGRCPDMPPWRARLPHEPRLPCLGA
jgi:probable HAF family extracellular repeat protein